MNALAGKTVTAISAGANHTCAIADSKAYCWGLNANGQLGDGTTAPKLSPQIIPSQDGYTVTAISAGTSHSCGIGSGVVYCWGLNGNGQVGNGQTTPSTTAVAVTTTSGDLLTKAVTDISAGTAHTCAIAASKAYCWGQSGNGQVGNYSSSGIISVPSTVYTGGGFTGTVTAITAGHAHTCAVAGGCLVQGDQHQRPTRQHGTTSSLFPVQATSNGAFSSTNNTAIAVGSSHSCSISNGDVYCWGLSTSARLRLGGSAITGNATTAQGAVTDARCATGSTALGNGTCPLKPDTTYYYRVKFTLDGTTATNGDWTGLKTS